MPMEALYAKLYEKYSKLKRKKLSELYEINKEQEEKFVNFTSASEVLIQHLRTENKKLQGIVDKFKNETTSIRSIKEKEFVEYQRLLMEEEKKNKALSEEVKNLKELFQERQHLCGSSQDSETPDSTQITTTRTNKRSRQSKDIIERDMISPQVSHHNKECCKTNHDTSGGLCDCIFQALGEQLLGMKLATSKQGGQVCIIALHPSSGLSFSLTWVKNLISEEESELLYKIVSLGTFDRVAPEWMREVVMFSTSMCPVFFERVSRVIKLHC